MRPHHKFWPPRLPHAITPPATSLWQNLAISALRYPDKPAIVFFGTVMTWAQLKAAAERLAAYLQSLGVQKGDRVVLNMQNSPQLVVAHFAILRARQFVAASGYLGLQVCAIANLAQLLQHLSKTDNFCTHFEAVSAYRARYGVD